MPRILPILLGIATATLGYLAGCNVRTTGLLGSLVTEHVAMVASSEFVTADLTARDLTISGFSTVTLPGTSTPASGVSELVLPRGSVVNIPGIAIPAGGQIEFDIGDRDRRLSMTITAPALTIDVIPAPDTTLLMKGEACATIACDVVFRGSRPIRVDTVAGRPLSLSLTPADSIDTLANELDVSALSLQSSQEYFGKLKERSGVVSGTLRLSDKPEQRVDIDRGTILRLSPAALVARAIDWNSEGIRVHLAGEVSDVSVDIGGRSMSLMPTLLDRLSGMPSAKMLAGILSLAIGGGISLMRPYLRKAKQ